MTQIIDDQIVQIKEEVKKTLSLDIPDEMAFNYLLLKIIYNIKDVTDHIVTDGKDDGGIDFIFYNDEDNKLILGQSKYTAKLSINEIINEYTKMHTTYNNFKKGQTSFYSEKLKRELQNGIDQLPDDNSGCVEFCLFTTANNEIDTNALAAKTPDNLTDSTKLFQHKDIENAIEAYQASIETVPDAKIKIDKAKNFLTYESKDLRGIVCNVSSSSIKRLFNLYQNAGLFDMNIRRFVPNKLVDEGIKKTLEKDRENFWFLNNGIIIACETFTPDGDTIHLTNFSIVNGGQTTQLIGADKGTNNTAFYIPCKIVTVIASKPTADFFNKIAEASNSQKPIFPRDLRSNSKEMVSLQRWLSNEKVYLEIKRGTKKPKQKSFDSSIKNDELGQLLLSFAHQQPGTSRSGKRAIFDNPAIYGKLFRENYQKTPEKKQFLLDLIKLNDRYKKIEDAFKKDSSLRQEQREILKNGKQTIFAFFGLCYTMANEDIAYNQISTADPETNYFVNIIEYFKYGAILSNYTKDDIDKKLKAIVFFISEFLAEQYQDAFDKGTVTSVSNFMKTDARYHNIAKTFASRFEYHSLGKDIKANWDIFKRQ